MPIDTVEDVIAALDAIIQRAWDEKCRIGYFAALYRRVTRAVRDGIARNQFSNGPLMEKLDVVFARRYLDALSAYQTHGKLSRCWRVAFDACEDESRLILQHLLAGMNAHINLDLGAASAQVSPGDQIAQLKDDFDEINTVLASQVGAVEDEMSALSPLIKDLSSVGLRTETTAINFNIELARKAAWFTAERLAKEPAVLHDVTLAGLDLAVSLEGRAILYPPFKGEALRAICAAEVRDVRRVIEILAADTPAEPAAGAASKTLEPRPAAGHSAN
ncbi:MAG TPA: DUF5995 family protein [Candidatus Bathyarchaeia archaeon]|nr:DUF5995 family protein [Candidatus Bathyarchaeia archaeon]